MIDLLVAARRDASLTQVDLGRLIRQCQTFISKIETGERRLDAAEFVLNERESSPGFAGVAVEV